MSEPKSRRSRAEPGIPEGTGSKNGPTNGNGHSHGSIPPAPPMNPGGGAEEEPRQPGPAPEIGLDVEVVRLPIADLNSAGYAYQRAVDMDYVDFLEDTWDWNAARTLLVNERPDGSLWLVDGQHRVLAARKKFGRDITVWCYKIAVAGEAEEAEIYEKVSDGHSRLSPAVLFRGRLTRREPVAVAIDAIVQEEGFGLSLLGKAESEFQISIPAVLDRIYKKDGPGRLRDVLAFCRDTWRGQRGFTSSHVVTGVAKFFEYFSGSPAWDRDAVVRVLAEFPLAQAVKEGKVVIGEFGYHRHVALAVAMQRLYNSNIKGKRNKLFRKGET